VKNNKRRKYLPRKVSRKRILKRLGDPKTWKKDEVELNKEFKKKPS
jgi:hypothetical protein